jgi:peptidoglycan/xylan/chitin deacetylase (PgdA/CDA1 family)
MQRREFVRIATAAVAGIATGVGVAPELSSLASELSSSSSPEMTADSWASTIMPDPAPGTARVWWSADPAVGRRLALTFDDGPTEQFTARVLDLLHAAGAVATFFVIGELVRRHPDLVRRAHDAGHEIGNHTDDHVSAAVVDRNTVISSVLRAGDAVETCIGRRPRWLRPPRGEVTSATMLAARQARLDVALWSAHRGFGPDPDTDGIRRTLLQGTAAGAIVNLHDGIGRSAWVGSPDDQLIRRRNTELRVLPEVLSAWRDAGYTLTTLSDLIPRSPGGSPGA